MSAQGVRRVGRYEVLREVGRGGMAVVYLARQTDLNRNVALKELAAFYTADPAFAERFIRESHVAGSFSHPNIVTVHDYFEHDGSPFIAMEYLERGSLRPLISRLSLPQVIGVLEGLLSGLAHAETRGVVHRDLKPENVMLTTEGGVKIADFGIAKAINSAATNRFLTATGTTVGTPSYMAPEQAMGRPVGPWTDLYSLGIIAYEMLVGEVPYADTETPVAIMLRQVNDPVPSVREAKPDLDPRLAGIVEKLLCKEPADRYQSAHEVWEELEEIAVSAVGPLWRREARLTPAAAAAETLDPLTPAPFHEESVVERQAQEEAEPDGFETFVPGRVRSDEPGEPEPELEPAEPAEPEPAAAVPAPAEATAEAVSEMAPAEAEPEAEPETELEPEPAGEFRTYLPRGAVAPVPPEVEEEQVSEQQGDDQGRQEPEPTPVPAPEPADEFHTYRPRGVVAPAPSPDAEEQPVPEQHVEEPEPQPEPEPEPEPVVAASAAQEESVGLTMPPTSRRKDTTFAWPIASDGRLRRLRSPWVAAAALGAIAVVAGVVVLGRDSPEAATPATPQTSSTANTTATTTPANLPTDLQLPDEQRLTLAVAGDRLYVGDPEGRVVQLDASTLKPRQVASDPGEPADLAVAAGSLYVADGKDLIRFRPTDLIPVDAAPLDGAAAFLAGGADVPLAAAFAEPAALDRVCLVSAVELGPCIDVGFEPAGIGVPSPNLVVAVDGDGGSVLPIRVSGGKLTPGRPIEVGKKPHGTLRAFRGRLYVPVERGVAVVDLAAATLETTIGLPTTPSSLWIVPFNGRLFATLPASNEVAMLDSSAPASEPTLVQVGKRPAAVAGALTSTGGRSVVYVVNSGDDTISRLDALTGKLLGSVEVAALAAAPPTRLIARTASFEDAGRVVTARIELEGGRLRPDALVVRDSDISDGIARIEIWQAGIATRFGRKAGHGVKTTLVREPARLNVRLAASAEAFTKLKARVTRDGRAVVIALTETPIPVVQPPSTPPPPSNPPPSNPPPSNPPPSYPPPSNPPPPPPPPPPTISIGSP